VIALSRGEQRARAFLARALELGAAVDVPVVVVAETLRGRRRDAPVHRVLKAVGSVPDTREAHGRTAGRLLGAARSDDTVDALVLAQAVEAGGAMVLTGDPDDLQRLGRPHPEVWVREL
jgi:predicted nucleic acid-binding protein